MFSWKFSRIFQSNHFVEHFRLATYLIFKGLPTEWQLPISFLETYVFSEFFSLRSELLLNCVEKPLRWIFQTSLVFCLPGKKNFFVWRGAIIEKTFNSINQWISRKSRWKFTWCKVFLCIISLSTWGWQVCS